MHHTIGLMHDDIICIKFTTKPRLHETFLKPLPFFVSWCLGNSFFLKFKVRTLKVRLGGEIGYSDVNMHKGY